MSTRRSTRSASRRDERGTGLFGSVFGVTAFLVFLLLAVQVAVALHARTAVGAAAYDAARVASGADGSTAAAEAGARSMLGEAGADTTFEWAVQGDDLVLRVRTPVPSILPASLRRPLGLDEVDRIVRIRRERVQPPVTP